MERRVLARHRETRRYGRSRRGQLGGHNLDGYDMKKLFLLLVLIWFMVGVAQAQTTTFTPNLNLALPPASPGTWGAQYNNNFTILDSANVTLGLTCTNGQIPTWSGAGFTVCGTHTPGNFDTTIAFPGDITP